MTNFLTDRIRLSTDPTADPEPEDYLSSAIGVIFPDDITNQHGDASTSVLYISPRYHEIHLSLADPSPGNTALFSHFVWNAAVQLAAFLEDPSASPVTEVHPAVDWDVTDKSVLELGAGTGLAGLLAALSGAKRTVITDYPAPEVLKNLETNVGRNLEPRKKEMSMGDVRVDGHEWGVIDDEFSLKEEAAFERILVADCLWMPHQHANLHKSIRHFLAPEGRAWVVAGFHTGREKMKGFYDTEVLREADLEIEAIWEREADGSEREWAESRGREDITERKRWLVIGVLKRRGA